MMQLTNLEWAITLEKLSLRILIRDVIKRMLVMQTKMSFLESLIILLGKHLCTYHERWTKFWIDLIQ
jgi:hypothetical protein